MANQPGSVSFQRLLESALRRYEKKTGVTLSKHPLALQLQSCNSVEDFDNLLQDQAKDLKQSERITKTMRTIVSILTPLSFVASIPDAVGLALPPAKAIQACLGVLLESAKGEVSNFDTLVTWLESVENFISRLSVYTDQTFPPAMVEILAKIMEELISTLALVTTTLKKRKRDKLLDFLGRKAADEDIKEALQRLDRLTQDELRNVAAQTLGVVGKMAKDVNELNRARLRTDIRSWLSPPDPSKNYNIACESRHEDTGSWFINSKIFSEWKSSGPSSLLWINGKPGAGKSVLCTAIIEDIETMRKSGDASLAMYFFDFRDDQKKDLRGLLSSILFQLCDQSDSCYNIISTFHSTYRDGAQAPRDDKLIQCLVDLVKLPGLPQVYLIVDGLDESPNTSTQSDHRDRVLSFLDGLVKAQLQNLRLCITSRPEVDITAILEPLAFCSVSLESESGQKKDMNGYIKSIVHADKNMKIWKPKHKQLVIDVLTEKADGMFRWVDCQLKYLAKCPPVDLERALKELPATLDETYERILGEIEDVNWEAARRLLQCVTVASRPLRVEELAEIIAFDFNTGPIPKFYMDCRFEDPVKGVLSICSTLLSLVNVEDSRVVQFGHFSVKEFLMSTRFTQKRNTISSRYHISLAPAHTVLAQACLGILLHLPEDITIGSLMQYPFAEYAGEHWFEHARFEGVSQIVIEGMKELFDLTKPHFAIWLWIYDPASTSSFWEPKTKQTERPFPPHGTPLHYATLCGLCDVVEVLVIGLQDVNSQNFRRKSTPLHLASQEGRLDIARLLVKHDANMAAQDQDGSTPLHLASQEGHLDVTRFFVEHGANAEAQDRPGLTPLHLASKRGRLDIARFLIEHGANAEAQDQYGSTPLHLASPRGHLDVARFLVGHGTNAEAQDQHGSTPLHLASQGGHLNVARFFVEHGANAEAQDQNGSTPLHLASQRGRLDVAQFLVDHGANIEAQDQLERTPLHLASRMGYLDVARFLVDPGANAVAQNQVGSTPFHLASQMGHLDVARFFVEHGANPEAQDRFGLTPLHVASQMGHLNVARFLVEHGANPEAQDQHGSTPFLLASKMGHLDVARFFVEHGASLEAQNRHGSTPFHLASQMGHLDVARFFVEHGANVEDQDRYGSTPFHLASQMGHLDVARFFVEHGANLEAQNWHGLTAFHLASQMGHLDVARFFVEHGANVEAQDRYGSTPLHLASQTGHLDVVRFFVEHSAHAEAQDQHGSTPLHLASQGGHLNVARLLVEHGANPEAQDQDGSTPLHLASQMGHLDVARFFVERGANVEAQDRYGSTPLHLASRMCYLDVARFFVAHSANVEAQDWYGSTPLHLASQMRHLDVARFFVEHGANVEAQDWYESTPLHLASQMRHLDVARFFVEHGANPEAQNRHESTPLHLASRMGYLDVARLLVEFGADVNVPDQRRWTPLHLASQRGHLDVARLLVEFSANVNVPDQRGWTPLHLASQMGHLNVARYLVEHGAHTEAQDQHGWTPLRLASQKGL